MNMMELSAVISIAVLLGDAYAIFQIVQSRRDMVTRAAWIALVLVLPLIGLAIWFVAGPREHLVERG